MKNRAKVSTFVLSLFLSFWISSCVEVQEGSASIFEENMTGVISNFADVCGTSSARTLFPTQVSSSSYDYYFYGSSTVGKSFQIQKVAVSPAGVFSVSVPAGFWQLNLFAVLSSSYTQSEVVQFSRSDVMGKASLFASTTADLTNGSASVPFNLSPDSLNGKGVVSASLVLSNDGGSTFWAPPAGSYAIVSVTSRASGEIIRYADGNPATSKLYFSLGRPAYFGSESAIPAGSYDFSASFFSKENKPIGSFRDTLLVIPGRELRDDIFIPNVVGEIPSAPGDFKATFVRDSEDLEGFEDNYLVHFSWTDNSDMENCYELQIADISGTRTGSLADEDAWTGIESSKRPVHTTESLTKLAMLKDGSLDKNSTEVTVFMGLGIQYTARIRAVGAAGPSPWVDVQIPSTSAGIPYSDGTLMPFVQANQTTAAKCINRYRIKYNLGDGSYWEDEYAAVFGEKKSYDTQHFPNSALTPADVWYGEGYDNASDLDDLKRPGQVLYSWLLNGADFFTKGYGGGYSGFANIDVYARYVGGTVSYGLNSEWGLYLKWIKFKTAIAAAQSDVISPSSSNYGTARFGTIVVSKSDLASRNEDQLFLSVLLPDDVDESRPGTQHFPSLFDGYECEFYGPDGALIHSYSVAASNYQMISTFPSENMQLIANGVYKYKITAKKTVNLRQYDYDVIINVVLTD